MEKHNSKKKVPHARKPERFGSQIILPKELEAMYDELPSMHDVNRTEKRKEYVEGLSEEDRKKYLDASSIAKAFQTRYTFKVEGTKCFPFTFNFRSKHWTVTWDREWLEKAAKVPTLATKIENLIEQLHQLAPRVKDKEGKDVLLTDAQGNPLTADDGTPLYKTYFDASKTYDRK